MDSNKLLDYLYNMKLPQVYRSEDFLQKPKYPLLRYLQAISDSGFKEALKEIDDLLFLLDAEKCPEYIVKYYLECFGIEYFEDIPLIYQRRILSGLGELIRRRGTYSCVRYLARLLTSMEVELTREDREGKIYLIVKLIAESAEQVANLSVSANVLNRYLQFWIPFWLNPETVTEIKVQDVNLNTYLGIVTISDKTDDIIPELDFSKIRTKTYMGFIMMKKQKNTIIPELDFTNVRFNIKNVSVITQSSNYNILPIS